MINWWIYGFWVFLLQLWQYLRAWNWPRPGLPSTFPTFWLPMSVTSWLFSSYLRFTVLFQREQVKDLINSQFGLEIIKEFFYCITKNTCILNINFCLFEVLVKWPTRRGIRLGHLVLWHVLVLHHKARVHGWLITVYCFDHYRTQEGSDIHVRDAPKALLLQCESFAGHRTSGNYIYQSLVHIYMYLTTHPLYTCTHINHVEYWGQTNIFFSS